MLVFGMLDVVVLICFLTFLLLIWFQTDVFVEYLSLVGVKFTKFKRERLNFPSFSDFLQIEHNNFFTFDANGNILAQQRYERSTLVDSLTYHYATNSAGQLLSNRLYSVDDSVTVASLSATDMGDMQCLDSNFCFWRRI